jgi:hypothetical protein
MYVYGASEMYTGNHLYLIWQQEYSEKIGNW